MFYKGILPAFALWLVLPTIMPAQPPPQPQEQRDGILVSFDNNQLVITDWENQMHRLILAPTATVMIDGKAAKKDDLQVGMGLTAHSSPDEPGIATRVEARSRE